MTSPKVPSHSVATPPGMRRICGKRVGSLGLRYCVLPFDHDPPGHHVYREHGCTQLVAKVATSSMRADRRAPSRPCGARPVWLDEDDRPLCSRHAAKVAGQTGRRYTVGLDVSREQEAAILRYTGAVSPDHAAARLQAIERYLAGELRAIVAAIVAADKAGGQ